MKFSGVGTVKVSNEVIDYLIARTALKVKGVREVRGLKNDKLQKNAKNWIHTKVTDDTLETELTIKVEPGYPIIEVVERVQDRVAEIVKSMLGLETTSVNLKVVPNK